MKNKVGLIIGPLLALIILLFFDLDPENPMVTRAAAVAVLMAVWWITEAIPIAATALIPVVLFPLFGVMNGKEVASIYFNHIIFLFIGGFIVALAMQKWDLHKRIALRIIMLIGTSPSKVILGFMVATAFLSMWISNTATTMMMIPIAMAIISKLEDKIDSENVSKLSIGLLIGIAYSASIGGVATLIGTPPNLSFTRILKIYFPQAPEITFAGWFVFGFPFALIFLFIAWRVLVWMYAPGKMVISPDRSIFKEEYRRLGKIGYEETVVLIAFISLAFLWLFRKNINIGDFTLPGWTSMMPVSGFIDDGTIAIFVALLLFIIPSHQKKGGRIMDWKTAVKLPWGIVLLFGGGFALASGFKESGLAMWMGGQLTGFSHFPPILIIGGICLMMTFLTELTSNTATTEMILPILGSLAVAIQLNPLLLMIPATLSASCAFMLPVATPPNAIIFGTNRIKIKDLIRTGILLNIIGAVLVTIAVYFLGSFVFDIDVSVFPIWAK
ncbi:MAG: SLC13/DASS family transporter [candidate division Zixibacteria bacterium]|nr:SLC13/DASS family transporter [candidate division Zixibacteria bacterium]